MKKIQIFVIIFIILIVLGFLAAFLIHSPIGCTKKGCPCPIGTNSERPCNSCFTTKYYFMSGILNVYKTCSGNEIILCENGIEKNKRYEFEPSNCKNHLNLFFILDLN
ncbi:MAG TPA: hypothetical protein VJJ52_06265 [Candidatus Nanoarchaeia archaeon]|nr:hypothetical protein [Candidatus Nanoarchaeia archaeon]